MQISTCFNKFLFLILPFSCAGGIRPHCFDVDDKTWYRGPGFYRVSSSATGYVLGLSDSGTDAAVVVQ